MQLRALVFDPDAYSRRVIEVLLQRRGYEVHSFGEAHPCRKNCQLQCADLIVADVALAGQSGPSFLMHQREVGCQARHIALTGSSWDRDASDLARRLGCPVFGKPFSVGSFLSWVETVESRTSVNRTLSARILQEGNSEAG